MKSLELKSGEKIPILGVGTWQLTGKKCIDVVEKAINMGYTHIDTAAAYGNHPEVSEGIKNSEKNRSDLFITSKIWRDSLYKSSIISGCKEILTKMDIEYLDLLLIHWPNKNVPFIETLEGLQELKDKGLVKNTGVSNFTKTHLKKVLKINPELISVNQIEFHPYLYQKDLLNFCQENDIVVTAYSPLARSKIFTNEVIKKLAEKYDKSPAQICLKWLMDKNIVVIPKASSEEHLKENMEIFDWELPADAQKQLNNFDVEERLVEPSFAEFNY